MTKKTYYSRDARNLINTYMYSKTFHHSTDEVGDVDRKGKTEGKIESRGGYRVVVFFTFANQGYHIKHGLLQNSENDLTQKEVI